jgi:Leucine-rich repeat (LRR) protein
MLQSLPLCVLLAAHLLWLLLLLLHRHLDNNLIDGTIPNSIGQMTSMQQLYGDARWCNWRTNVLLTLIWWYRRLQNNCLIGTIPNMARLTGLQQLRLNNNSLSGPFPPSITNLQYVTLLYVPNVIDNAHQA